MDGKHMSSFHFLEKNRRAIQYRRHQGEKHNQELQGKIFGSTSKSEAQPEDWKGSSISAVEKFRTDVTPNRDHGPWCIIIVSVSGIGRNETFQFEFFN
jgi:hypothetical protein